MRSPWRWHFIILTLLAMVGPRAVYADVWTDFTFGDNAENEFTSTGYFDSGHNRVLYWAAFAGQGGFIDSNPASVEKNGDIWGDIGAAGTGNLSLEDGIHIHQNGGRGGNVYYHTGGKYNQTSGAIVDGAVVSDSQGDSILQHGENFALYATDYAFSQPSTYPGITNVMLKGSAASQTITLTQTRNVLSLQNFTMQGGTFTLVGTAIQSIIINVAKNFLMNGGAKIVLSGGLKWDNVLFNIHGTGNVVSFDQSAELTGIVLAPKRHVRLKGGSIVNGSVIGEEIELASLSQIKHPTVVSP